jgi:kinesin family protein 13
MSEPAVLVKRKGKSAQVWSVDKMEQKLVDMREAYEEFQRLNRPLAVWREEAQSAPALLTTLSEAFWESQESHSLIGVANFFLDVLFQDVALSYNVPVVSQQGEVAGKLLVSSVLFLTVSST